MTNGFGKRLVVRLLLTILLTFTVLGTLGSGYAGYLLSSPKVCLSQVEKQQAAAGIQPEHKSKSGIVVHGLYDVAVHFSKCCNPVPGDEIVGFVTRGRGISIHRTDCVNIINLSKIEKDRLIEAEWQDTALMDNGAEYQADLKIFCHDRPGLLVDITKIFTEKEINISGIQSKTSKQGIATIEVFFNIKGRDQIKVLVEKLRQIESVIDVERTTG